MPANMQKSKARTGKRGGKTSTSWQPGQSGNPAGRPREGQSWSAVIKEVTDKTADELAAMVGRNSVLGRALAQMPKGVPLKTLIVIRMVAALMFDPTAGMARALLETEELSDMQAAIAELKQAVQQ